MQVLEVCGYVGDIAGKFWFVVGREEYCALPRF